MGFSNNLDTELFFLKPYSSSSQDCVKPWCLQEPMLKVRKSCHLVMLAVMLSPATFFFLNAETTNSQNQPWCGYVCVRSGRGLFSCFLKEYSVELLINSSQEVRGMYYSYHSSSYAFACPHNWGRGISFDADFVLGIAHRVDHRLTPSVLEKWLKEALRFVL